MNLGKNDLHLEFDPNAEKLKGFDAAGKMFLVCECRNRTTNDGSYSHNGWVPPGDFILAAPEARNTVPFGAWFIPILDVAPGGPMAQNGRAGIGIHAGGSGLAQPLSPHQGWQITHGCLRLQGADLALLVKFVHTAQKTGKCFITVVPRHPGAELLAPQPSVLAVLHPDE